MKKILITGANSYIGVTFENYIKNNFAESFTVDTVDMIDGSWREKDFSGYDTIFHVAGIAHQKETKQNKDLYYKINRDLAIETAKKAKDEGVKQFIFLSSMSVYGIDTGTITKDSIPKPKSNYGKSKLQAEEGINALKGEFFKVAILRPPMVYGKGCKGNYQTLRSFALKYRLFPTLKNTRSMIYVDNLSIYIEKIVSSGKGGLFLPQNPSYVCTRELVCKICEHNCIKMRYCLFFNLIKFFPISTVKKVFGNLYYKDIDTWSKEGILFDKTIALSEG